MAINCDPSSLANAARCFDNCVPPGSHPAIHSYLLCQIASGGGTGIGGSFFVADTVFVDPEFGSDATGARELPSKPFATLTAAKNAAIAGDTIFVRPSTYPEHDLLKDQVNWFFMPGAIVDYTITHTDNRGIFDDQGGAATSRVMGYGVFKIKDTSSDTSNPNTTMLGGVVVITNALSDFRIEAIEFNAGAWDSAAGIAVQVNNCAYCEVRVGRILDPFFGMTQEDPSNPGNFLPSAGTGTVWIKGEMYLDFDQCKVTSYGIWANGPNDANVDTNLWVNGNYCESNGAAALYGSGKTGGNYRVWVDVKVLISTGFATGTSIIGGGKYYIVSDKIASTLAQTGPAFNVSEDTGTRATVWLTAQKLSSFAGPILVVNSGTVYAEVLNFEDFNSAVSAINVTGPNAELHLTGGYSKIFNGKGIVHSGGLSYINGFRVDTSNTNVAANNPVSVSAAGLILQNCVLIAGTNAASITAGAAQTVKIVTPSAATTAKNVNVTLAPNAGFTVDPAVA